MKKLICLLAVTIISLFAIAQPSEAQEKSKDSLKRILQVKFEKSKYILLEPILAKFKLTIPSTDSIPGISKGILVKINFEGRIHEFRGLTSLITQGVPQPLPIRNPIKKDTNIEPKYYDYSEEKIIDRVGEFFPEPGNYKIQFFLIHPNSQTIVPSNVIEVTIEKPTNINNEAFNYLNKYENAMSFYWVWEEKNGLVLLEEFVSKYGQSVYGEYAIDYLGKVYLAKGELDKAQVEFEKILSSNNKYIAENAKKSLADINTKKKDLEQIKQKQN